MKFFREKLNIVHFLIVFVFTLATVAFAYVLFMAIISSSSSTLENWSLFAASSIILTVTIWVLNYRRKSYRNEEFVREARSFIYVKYLMIFINGTIIIISLINSITCTYNKKNDESNGDLAIQEFTKIFQDSIYHPNDTSSQMKLNRYVRYLQKKWCRVESKRGKFSIEFPVYHVTEKRTRQLLNNKKIDIYSYSLNTQHTLDSNLGYSIIYFPVPQISTINDLNAYYNEERDDILHTTNSNLISEFVIDTLSYPAREINMEMNPSDIRMTVRFFYYDGIFYKLIVLTDKQKLFNNMIYRFLNSFRIRKSKNDTQPHFTLLRVDHQIALAYLGSTMKR